MAENNFVTLKILLILGKTFLICETIFQNMINKNLLITRYKKANVDECALNERAGHTIKGRNQPAFSMLIVVKYMLSISCQMY